MRWFSLLLVPILSPFVQAADDRPLPVRMSIRILGLNGSVELPEERMLTGDDVARLAAGDNLQWSRHLEVVTLNGTKAQLQMGETNNVITGIVSSRTSGAPSGTAGGRGGFAPPDDEARRSAILQMQGGRSSRSTTAIQTGTLVQVTPRLVDRGVVLDLTIECSRLAPAGEEESGIPARETQTITSQSTVLVSDGQPVVMRATVQSEDASASGHVLIVINAEATQAAE